jgi:uncharacterized protein (TIGR03435 family)
MPRGVLCGLGMIFSMAPLAYPQTTAPAPLSTFEVSTVKLSPPDQRDFWFRQLGPQVFEANNHTIRECIAYFFDIYPKLILGGPAWIDFDHYLITAKLPDDMRPSSDELKRMFQVLLAERFQLKVHHESKEVPVYLLEVGKKGFKLQESTEPGDASMRIGRGQITGRNSTMPSLARFMQRLVLDRPVIDKTGLKGKYDFDLLWRPDESQFGGQYSSQGFEDRPDIYHVLDGFGLKLQSSRAMADILVVDYIDRPDEN